MNEAEFHVRQRLPGAHAIGKFSRDLDLTIYSIRTSRDETVATALSAAQAWEAAAAIISFAADPDDRRYLGGEDVQRMIGAELRRQGRWR